LREREFLTIKQLRYNPLKYGHKGTANGASDSSTQNTNSSGASTTMIIVVVVVVGLIAMFKFMSGGNK
jgi:hypothetical protein